MVDGGGRDGMVVRLDDGHALVQDYFDMSVTFINVADEYRLTYG